MMFFVVEFLMILSSNNITIQLNSIFANDYTLVHFSNGVYLGVFIFIFILSNLVLIYYFRRSYITSAVVKMTYIIFITYNLAITIPLIFHMLFLKMFEIGSSQYGFHNPQDHTVSLIFIRFFVFLIAGICFKNKLFKSGDANEKL